MDDQFRYLKEANKVSSLDIDEKMSKLKSCCNRVDLVDERLLWVPEKVFNIA